jgi:hypothetical protein
MAVFGKIPKSGFWVPGSGSWAVPWAADVSKSGGSDGQVVVAGWDFGAAANRREPPQTAALARGIADLA